MRFDDRVTGRLKDFAPNAKIIHIDIDPAEIGKNLPTAVPIVGDVKQRAAASSTSEVDAGAPRRVARLAGRDLKASTRRSCIPETDKILPQYVIKSIYDASGADAYYVTGVGQHQMWAAQYFWIDKPNGFITSGGLGTMGFEVPAAIGAQFADPKSTVWSICGDGGFQMTSQELATVVEYELPIKFAIINNGYLGMVRQWQEHVLQEQPLRRAHVPARLRQAGRGLRHARHPRDRQGRRCRRRSTLALATPAPCSSTSRSKSPRTPSRWCRREPRCRRRSTRRTRRAGRATAAAAARAAGGAR